MRFQLTRRKFLLTALAGMAAAPGYARFLEPGWFEVTRPRIPLGGGKLRRELRVLHLSDLHASDAVPFPIIEEAIELGLAGKPDFACLTGDFITHRLADPATFTRVLSVLGESVPTFASFGNHDGGRWARRHRGHPNLSEVRRALEAAGVICLRNEARLIDVGEQPVHLVGVGDLWSGDVDPDTAFGAAVPPDGTPTIVLAHNPDTRDWIESHAWDLMLSGHTHGGQVVVPLVGYAPFVAVHDPDFLEGLRAWNGRQIYITRGVGSLLGVRFACRPEVSLHTLVPA